MISTKLQSILDAIVAMQFADAVRPTFQTPKREVSGKDRATVKAARKQNKKRRGK